jgi:hypothetical protein
MRWTALGCFHEVTSDWYELLKQKEEKTMVFWDQIPPEISQ